MSGVIPTLEGEPIRLNLQLSDGDTYLPLIVRAYLRDDLGSLLDTKEMTHVGLGLFKDSTFIMPEEVKEITAQYQVFENDGVTPAPYSFDIDIFRPTEQKELDVEALISRLSTDSIEVDINDDTEVIEVDVHDDSLSN